MFEFFEFFGEFHHALGGRLLDDVHGCGHLGRVGVDVVDGDAGTHVLDEGGGGVDNETCTYHHKNIGLACQLGGRFEVGHGLLKEDDVRAHMVSLDDSVDRGVDASAVVIGEDEDQIGVVRGFHLHQLAVQVQYLG